MKTYNLRVTKDEIKMLSDMTYWFELCKSYDSDKRDEVVPENDTNKIFHWRWKQVSDMGLRLYNYISNINRLEKEDKQLS